MSRDHQAEGRAADEAPKAPPTETGTPPERASLALLFSAAALGLLLLLAVVAAVAVFALRP